MAGLNYENVNRSMEVDVSRPNWSAIWAGMFSFIAIWSVFGMLAIGIFEPLSHPKAAGDIGLSIWGIVLTIIAMFVGGRITGDLVGPTNSRIMHGMVMFGLSVAAAMVILAIGGNVFGSTQVNEMTHSSLLRGMIADQGWALFVALLLGWLAAMGGAYSAHRELAHPGGLQQQVSHA